MVYFSCKEKYYIVGGAKIMEELNLDAFLSDVAAEEIDAQSLELSPIAVAW